MGVEIERKFLVHRDQLPRDLPAGDAIEQGYLANTPTVRVRVRTAPDGTRRGELTIKGKGKLTRAEYNYEIPADDGAELLELSATSLRKTRRVLGRWELDFFPELDLWLAEIELEREDEPFEKPAWVAAEVTLDPAYSNSRLASATSKR